jgi:MFS family permease
LIALCLVYMGANIPQYGLSFFLPQIVKAFGASNVTAGFNTAVPYVVGAIGMVLWGLHSDRTGERRWPAVIAFLFIVAGLGLTSITDNPTIKMLFLCVAGFGFFAGGARLAREHRHVGVRDIHFRAGVRPGLQHTVTANRDLRKRTGDRAFEQAAKLRMQALPTRGSKCVELMERGHFRLLCCYVSSRR